jgi:hypothetical protein
VNEPENPESPENVTAWGFEIMLKGGATLAGTLVADTSERANEKLEAQFDVSTSDGKVEINGVIRMPDGKVKIFRRDIEDWRVVPLNPQ